MKRGRPRKKAHVCGKCGYTTRLSYRFRQHVSLHTGERPYRCAQCDYATIQKVNLLKHMAGHARNSPVKCQQCGYSTNQQSALSRHLAVHLEQKATNSEDALTSDKDKAKHSSRQLFCDKDEPETNIEPVPSTRYQSAQTNHTTTHNKKEAGKSSNAMHMPSTVSVSKPKQTLVNGEREPETKRGKHRKRRKKQLKDNNETKPFVCTKCGYATAHKRDFKRHMLKHSSDKPYKCDRCDYSAVQKSHLHAHMKGHTRNGLLKCKYCGFSSDYQSVVTRHEEVHLRKEADRSGNSTTSQGENQHVNSETTLLLNVKDRYKLRDKVGVVKPETAHTGEKPYKHRRRASNAEEEKHQHIKPSTSNSSNFPCWHCQEIHTAEKPCKIQRPDSEEEERPVSRKIKPSASNLSKPFRCGQCAYLTNDVWKFDHHLLEHSCLDLSKKRYLCGLCSFTAAKKSSWDRHTLKHCDAKPFACNKCNFRTKYEVYLSAHAKRMHPSQKPKTYKHVKHVTKFSRPRYDPKSKYKDMYTVKYNYPATAYSCKKCEYAAALKSDKKSQNCDDNNSSYSQAGDEKQVFKSENDTGYQVFPSKV
ncbi:hypothetical protein Bbelb_197680 [Branchiostoma belcheri]|nr:hypothetical protein Bbelb_197680 [Branchiostoma belcheri]